MDMKKILQAIDSASTKPVEGASDMKRFVSIIQDSNKEQVLNEGANPHKVSLPVQMAMQHYQQPVEKKPSRPALIDKYFTQVQDEQLEERTQKRQLINQYAQTIAERVMMKESVVNEKSVSQKQARTMAAAAHDPKFAKKLGIKSSVAKEFNKADTGTKQLSNAMKKEGAWHTSPSGARTNMSPKDDDYAINYGKHGAAAHENFNPNLSPNPGFKPGPGGPGMQSAVAEDNKPDIVSLDIPLLIRLLEYAREDAKDDIVIHDIAENMINLCASGDSLSMDDYNKIIPSNDIDQNLPEAGMIKAKKKSNSCWTGYTQVGMQNKGGKTVPRCTKIQGGAKLDELSNEKLGQYKTAAHASAKKADQEGNYKLGDKRFAGINKATNKQFANDLKKYTGK